jgi:uncharacterized membrane protein
MAKTEKPRQRSRNRIKSRVDELPEEIRQELDKMLADVNITYQEISQELTQKGYTISKSAVGRYALRQNAVARRLKEAAEQTRAIIETVKENRNIDAAGAANTLVIDALIKKFATAQEEFEMLPLDKAARIAVQLERTAIFKEKFKMEFDRGVQAAAEKLKDELKRELNQDPELLRRLEALVDATKENVSSSHR